MMAVAAYQLKSDLARACLPVPGQNAQRRLAWVNSICIFFLLIGITGASTRFPAIMRPPPLEQPIPVIIEPLAAPPTSVTKEVEPKNQDEKEIAPRVVAVTLNTPQIAFSVPTIGNLLVPVAAAPAPPPVELRPAVQAKAVPAATGDTGSGGDRPKPDTYPQVALDLRQEGTVVLLLTVDDVGGVTSVSVKETSGFPILDRNARDWVKRHWIQPPINGNHTFQTSIHYRIQQ
jgi:TonB family protein